MQVVLYTSDMQPITVLDLNLSAIEFIRRNGCMRFAVHSPLRVTPFQESVTEMYSLRTVTILMDHFYNSRGMRHEILYTHDEESALIMKSAFLPGQLHTMQEREKRAYCKGILDTMNAMR